MKPDVATEGEVGSKDLPSVVAEARESQPQAAEEVTAKLMAQPDEAAK